MFGELCGTIKNHAGAAAPTALVNAHQSSTNSTNQQNKNHQQRLTDHLGVLDRRVARRHLLARLEEQAVALLHDVGLVHGRHAAPVVEEGKLEGVLGDAQALVVRDDLEALDDAVDDLVLQAAVLALGVLASF